MGKHVLQTITVEPNNCFSFKPWVANAYTTHYIVTKHALAGQLTPTRQFEQHIKPCTMHVPNIRVIVLCHRIVCYGFK
jgi:hypothetical protein